MIMSAYPGYTIRAIKDEMSWRDVKNLIEFGAKNIQLDKRLERIEELLCKHFGIRWETADVSDARLMSGLEEMGALAG